MRRLEVFNAARQIAEAEKKIAENQTTSEKVPTLSPTVAENPANFLVKETEGKSNQIN